MATFLGCGSREAEAWLLSTLGDKGRALLEELHRINADYGLELYVNTAVPARIFTNDVAKNVNDVMTKEAEFLDCALGRIRYGRKTATRESTRIAKDLCLLALTKTGFVDDNGRPMSVNSFCKRLGWRRPDHRVFLREADVEQYENELQCYWTVEESRRFLKSFYARIKDNIL